MKKIVEILKEHNLNISDNPNGTDKGDKKSYVACFYEKEFAPYQSKAVRLLEIGVRTGASLKLWANYFANAEIHGYDIESAGSPAGPQLDYITFPNVRFHCENAYDYAVIQKLQGKFDILIDDGPHSAKTQIIFIKEYLKYLQDYGIMIIEDVQRGYRDSRKFRKAMPAGNKYCFETCDFRHLTKTGDDFLFVIRHNRSGKSIIGSDAMLLLRSTGEWIQAIFARIGKLFIRGSRS